MIEKIPVEKNKFILGGLFVCFAWLFPFFEGASPDALPQIFSLAMLSAAALLFGMRAISKIVVAAITAMIFLVALQPSHYPAEQVAGIAGLLLASVGCYVGANLQRKPQGLTWMLAAIVAAAIVNAIEGLLQWFGLVGNLTPWVLEPAHRGLSYGAFRQQNLFATFLCVGSLCTVWLFYKRCLSESMAWFLLLFLMFGVAASGSRTGILEVVALGGCGLLWRMQQTPGVRRLLLGQLVLLGGALLALPVAARWHGFNFLSGAERVAQSNQDTRFVIWGNAVELISQRPWFGWGWRETGYGHYVTLFENRYQGALENVHNLPLQLAVEFGLPFTIVLFCTAYFAIFYTNSTLIGSIDRGGSDSQASERSFAWGILLLIVGIHSMLEYPLWYAGFLFVTGISVGYLLPSRSHNKLSITFESWSERIAKVIALGLLTLAFVAWQQYARVLPIYKTPFTNDREVRHTATRHALANASSSWLYQGQLDFTILGFTEVTSQNAFEVRQLAEKVLHYSAEPRVIQPLLLSLWYLNDDPSLRFHAHRFCIAFPVAFQRWSQDYANHPMLIAAERSADGCLSTIP